MKWIDEVRGNDSLREVARRAGLHQATFNRQVNLGALTFEVARDISRAYGRPVLADLIALGHLSASDAGADDIERILHAASDEQLVLEVARRLDATSIGTIYDKPVSEAIEEAEATVHRLPVRKPRREVANDTLPEYTQRPDGEFE